MTKQRTDWNQSGFFSSQRRTYSENHTTFIKNKRQSKDKLRQPSCGKPFFVMTNNHAQMSADVATSEFLYQLLSNKHK